MDWDTPNVDMDRNGETSMTEHQTNGLIDQM